MPKRQTHRSRNPGQGLFDRANQARDRGDLDEAESCFRKSLELRREVLDQEDPAVAQSMNEHADVLFDQEQYEEACPDLREALPREHRYVCWARQVRRYVQQS